LTFKNTNLPAIGAVMTKNRLDRETSPYLLQHKNNPVHWFPWGVEAFDEARKRDRPVLLSVGYAACHWCHVMAHESFEDEQTAVLMNDLFINIKVDREERPDVDSLYMAALHRIGDQGGWPLTMFLTPDAEPFWGGTYFPKTARYGRPAFSDLLREVARIFREEHERVLNNAAALRAALTPRAVVAPQGTGEGRQGISLQDIKTIATRIAGLFDPIHGGLNGAPKFPNAAITSFTWKAGLRLGLEPCRKAVETTLVNICQGGIYDHLGGGMARYSVDTRWLTPHFEKMLYDNALLVEMLTEAWKETRQPLFEKRASETVVWMVREMMAEGGGFAASLDADSEGVEGKFYVWSLDEVLKTLGDEDGAFFAQVYDVSEGGNWEGVNILNRLESVDARSEAEEARLAELRAKLFRERGRRVRPGWDDKTLADWNGLAISALVKAGDAFGRSEWIEAGRRAYGFVKERMGQGRRLRHSFRAGRVGALGMAPDYANMIGAALTLYCVTGDKAPLADAQMWAESIDRHHWAPELGGYYLSADDASDIIIRTITAQDDATPNANATMLGHLMALYLITGAERYRERAEALLAGQQGAALESQAAHTGFLSGVMDVVEPLHVVVVGSEDDPQALNLRRAAVGVSAPGAVVEWVKSGDDELGRRTGGMKWATDGRAAAYVCSGVQCLPPVSQPEELVDILQWRRHD
jgi:uncharacterized protein